MKNVHDGHREKIREEFKQYGLEHFKDHEVLELLLFYTISRTDTNVLGHNLIEKFGSFSGVIDAQYELLCEVDGIGKNSALYINLLASIIKRYMEDQNSKINYIKTPDDAISFMQYKFICQQRESIYLACLGNNGKVVFCTKVADGEPDTIKIIPSNLIKTALRADAVQVVIAHNHPNGICNPSSQDLRTTSILIDEFRKVDIELIDHIIVGADGVYSMKKNNMFPSH